MIRPAALSLVLSAGFATPALAQLDPVEGGCSLVSGPMVRVNVVGLMF